MVCCIRLPSRSENRHVGSDGRNFSSSRVGCIATFIFGLIVLYILVTWWLKLSGVIMIRLLLYCIFQEMSNHPQKLFDPPKPSPMALEVLRAARTMICLCYSQLGGYSSKLNYYIIECINWRRCRRNTYHEYRE